MVSCGKRSKCEKSPFCSTEEVSIANRRIRVNEAIRAESVRVIDPDGKQLGVMPLKQALQEARNRGLDLVEVAPQASPPVCRILDYGKYKYQLEKREKKKHKVQKLKEMRFTSQIEEHDFMTKVRHIQRFLQHGDKVKVTVIFRGREIVHTNRGRELLDRLVEATQGYGKVDQPPTMRGRSLQMLLVPTGELREAAKAAQGQGQNSSLNQSPNTNTNEKGSNG